MGKEKIWVHTIKWAFLVAQTVKNLRAMKEAWVRSLDWEDPLKKGMAAHFSILAWRIPSTEEPGRLHRVTKSWTQLSNFHFRLLRSTHKHMICKNVVYSCFPTFQKLLKKILLYSICLFLNLKTICMYLFVF